MKIQLFTPVVLAVLLSACSDLCQNTALSNTPSPDSRLHAVVFVRDCGATTDYSTQISIGRNPDLPGGGGNVFIADGGSASAPPTDHGGPWAEVVWQGSRHLLVRYDSMAEVYKQEDQVAGVTITYEPVQR